MSILPILCHRVLYEGEESYENMCLALEPFLEYLRGGVTTSGNKIYAMGGGYVFIVIGSLTHIIF